MKVLKYVYILFFFFSLLSETMEAKPIDFIFKDGLLKEAKAIPELAHLLIKISTSEKNRQQFSEDIEKLLEEGVLTTIAEGLIKKYGNKLAHELSYYAGENTITLATFFVSFGAVTKGGKITNLVKLVNPLQDAIGVLNKVSKAGLVLQRSGQVFLLKTALEANVFLAKIDAENVFKEVRWLNEGQVVEQLKNITYIDNGVQKTASLTLVKQGDEVGFRVIDEVGDLADILKKGIKNLNASELIKVVKGASTRINDKSIIIKTLDAATANQQFTGQQINRFGYRIDLNRVNPPHAEIPEAGINDFKLLEKKYFVRVSNSSNNPKGQWLVSLEDFNNFRSADDIKDALALPEKPTHFSIAEIPDGIIIRESLVAKVWQEGSYWGKGAAIQYQIQEFVLDNPIHQSWFSGSIELTKIFNHD